VILKQKRFHRHICEGKEETKKKYVTDTFINESFIVAAWLNITSVTALFMDRRLQFRITFCCGCFKFIKKIMLQFDKKVRIPKLARILVKNLLIYF
jgi:hypothetical protein